MSESKYLVATGYVQKFKDKPAVNKREANGKTLHDVTIKTVGKQQLVRITIWPEHDLTAAPEGAILDDSFISVEGKLEVSENNGRTYYNISASKLHVDGKRIPKQERNTVANAAADASDDDAPF